MFNYTASRWPIFFVLLGVVSLLGQVVLLRELTTLFYGNELFYGLGLGLWLLAAGLGSLWAPRLKFLTPAPKSSRFLSCGWGRSWLLGLSFWLPVLVVALRWLVSRLVPVGGLPPLGWGALLLAGSIFLLAFPVGAVFPLAVAGWKNNRANEAYLWEALGLALAGLLFSFYLNQTTFPLTAKINRETLTWRYPNLKEISNSRYQQIMTTETNGQTNVFLNGNLAFTSQESLASQEFLALVTPFTPDLRRVLVLGSPSLALEVSRQYPSTQVDYLEVDPQLLELTKSFLIEGVNRIPADPRRFLTQSRLHYDLILFSPGNPATLLTNRYFTEECFQAARSRLTDGGVLAVANYLPTDYQSQEAIRFGASIYQTLKSVFAEVDLLTPTDSLIFLASSNLLEFNGARIDPAWSDHINEEIGSPRAVKILTSFENFRPIRLNTDSEPVTFFYQQLFGQTMLNFRLPNIITTFARIAPILIFLTGVGLFLKSKRPLRLGLLAAGSGFTLMSLETLIIFSFQSQVGYLYSQVSLLFAAVLLGMAAGVYLGERVKHPNLTLRQGLFGYLLVLTLLMTLAPTSFAGEPFFWLEMALLSGVVGGWVFGEINSLYLKDNHHPGFIYAFDLFGSFLGAILTAGLILPVWGLAGVVWGLGGLLVLAFAAAGRLAD